MEQEALSPDAPAFPSLLCKFMQQNVTVSATLVVMLMQITSRDVVLGFSRSARSKTPNDKQDLMFHGNDV